jgi:large subunit ribosomal protein L10
MPSHQVLEQKASAVQNIEQLLKAYTAIGIASLQKVRAAQLQELKKNLAGKVHLCVLKNTLVKIAIERTGNEALKQLEKHLEGPNLFLFTNLNPFKLALILEKGRVKTIAKAGDIAADDVIVPAGNTGQPPGPIISQLNSVGLPTRIESGSVWISKDTLVVRKGETINERLASVLSKLGIKAGEAGLTLKVAYDSGLVIPQDQLKLDLEGTRKSLEQSQAEAYALSLSIAYPTRENITALLQIAQSHAYALSMNAAIPTKETIADLIRKANAEMLAIKSLTEKQQPN